MASKFMIPEGTRDLILEECATKKKLQRDIESILDKWGYDEIVTPTIEFYQTFNSGFESLEEEDVYKFIDSNGKILVLRPDMTVPIARVVATKFKNVEETIRLRYSADVFRVHESLGGKKNEYTDCGIELIGLKAEESDLEILVTALDTLKLIKNTDYNLEIGNIDFFNSAIKRARFTDEQKDNLARLIEKKSIKELHDYVDELETMKECKEFLKQLPLFFGGREILENARKYAFNLELKYSIDYLEKIADNLEKLGYKDCITFDLGMVPRLDYYSGIIFKGYADGVGTTVLSGGRYDNLIAKFGKDVPAIGFSINLDSMVNVMKESEVETEYKYKVYYGIEHEIQVIEKAMLLREEGKTVELVPVRGLNGVDVKKEVKNKWA